MALDLNAEQKATGKANFQRAANELGQTRRGFMKGLVGAAAAGPLAAAAYYGYHHNELGEKKAVKAGLIGGGDEGGVLVGEHNPDYLEFIAVCDIRPYNQRRIFDG